MAWIQASALAARGDGIHLRRLDPGKTGRPAVAPNAAASRSISGVHDLAIIPNGIGAGGSTGSRPEDVSATAAKVRPRSDGDWLSFLPAPALSESPVTSTT